MPSISWRPLAWGSCPPEVPRVPWRCHSPRPRASPGSRPARPPRRSWNSFIHWKWIFGGSLTTHPWSLSSWVKFEMGISTTLLLIRTDFRGSDPSLKTCNMSGMPCPTATRVLFTLIVCLKLSNLMQLVNLGWSQLTVYVQTGRQLDSV